jgi:hypothetical protein
MKYYTNINLVKPIATICSKGKQHNWVCILRAMFYFLWFLEVLEIFLGILLKLKEKKNQILELGRDLARGLLPYGLAACVAGRASRPSGPVWSAWPSSCSGWCRPATRSSAARVPMAVTAHGPDTAAHWPATKEAARGNGADGLSTSDVRASRLTRRAGGASPERLADGEVVRAAMLDNSGSVRWPWVAGEGPSGAQ